ncbi:Hpt domain-containing protein [Vibrio sp. SCSIO 43136]|uniref:Hpt domain-containing protein n=1 Tax=Vibrio sp. SCSIO 43136 TaxID=2819101 RepID=UPI0020764245|nr:Hpt domain-containing protein [Vibrio sp. SCSIO 43136]USD63971.1 Hpt domain-containing protein [Vibrio sp. SCSIO 43136]
MNAIARVGDNISIYHRLLSQWMEGDEDFGQRMRDAMQAQDYDNAILYVHSLKGSSGNLGAMHISEQAKAIEMMLRENPAQPVIERSLDNLIVTLHQFFTELQTLVVVPETVPTTRNDGEVPSEEAKPHLLRLINYLSDFDTRAIDHIEQHYTILDAAYGGEPFQRCYRLIHACDFAAAQEILEQLSEQAPLASANQQTKR